MKTFDVRSHYTALFHILDSIASRAGFGGHQTYAVDYRWIPWLEAWEESLLRSPVLEIVARSKDPHALRILIISEDDAVVETLITMLMIFQDAL